MMLPELDFYAQDTGETPEVGKSFLFDFGAGEFVLRDGKFVGIEGVEAVRQWVDSTLRTEKYKYLIYRDHGIELESLIEKQLPYRLFAAEAERAVREALEAHDHIKSIADFEFERSGSRLKISFTIHLSDGLSFGGEFIV